MPLDNLDPEEQKLLEIAILGEEVDNFFQSSVGKYLMQRTDAEILAGFKGLKDCDPEDPKLVRKFQNQIWRAESVRDWLEEAVLDGLNATKVLEDRRTE